MLTNPVNLDNRVKNSGFLVDFLTNHYTAIDAAPIACDPAGNLTRDRQGRTNFELWFVTFLFTV